MKYPIRASKVDGFRTKSYCVSRWFFIYIYIYILTYDARKLKHKIDGKKFIKLVFITRVYGDVRSTKLLKKCPICLI